MKSLLIKHQMMAALPTEAIISRILPCLRDKQNIHSTNDNCHTHQFELHTVYLFKYAHCFVMLCFIKISLSVDLFTDICQGYFTGASGPFY